MQDAIIHEIERFVRDSPANLHEDGVTPYFEPPLVGFAAAADPLFDRYKQIIGDFYLTPAELLPGAEAVICWVLPIAEKARLSNRGETRLPSKAWAHTRDRGEMFNVLLRRQLVAWLAKRGQRALAPQLSERWQMVEIAETGPASNWSERHTAYAAGLGTFSLNDALITPKGIAHRLGSIVTDCVLPPTPRNYPNHKSNCLRYQSGDCGLCIDRCPVGALSDRGHDKLKCRTYVYSSIPDKLAAEYAVKATGCGLCQTAVPCEFHLPAETDHGPGNLDPAVTLPHTP